MAAPDTIQVFVPLKLRKKNGRPKILPPNDCLPNEDQIQDPHILRAIGRAWAWRRRMEAGEFGTVRDLAIAVNLAERHVSRQLRLAYLAPEVLKRLVFGRIRRARCLDKRWPQHFAKAYNHASTDYRPATTKASVQLPSSHESGAIDQVASFSSHPPLNERDL